ncbi:MAG: hypothetical protein K0S44_2801 [Bacteroidetes bacterium]|jgi:predicted component of type VI protein secretion system|nr:hypothetical protein [Bacteroidota bacterium]
MKNRIIYPGEITLVNYWTKRWGITRLELNEAILQTGSIKTEEIKKYLLRKRTHFSVANLISRIRLYLG